MNFINYKKIILVLSIIVVFYSVSFGYTSNVHQYIIEQAYELLKCETGIEYIEYNEGIYCYDEDWDPAIIQGAIKEDVYDWVYHYHITDPEFNQVLIEPILNLIRQSILLYILGVELPAMFPSVTHFWDADAGIYDNSFLSGEMAGVDWSIYIDNAFVKAKRYFEGYESGNPYWITARIHIVPVQDVFDYPYPQTTYPYVYFEPYGINTLFQNGSTRLYDWVPPGIKGDLITNPVETFSLSNNYRQHLSFNILGRILHLLADMAVPAHSHNDEHASIKYTVLGDWHTHTCDKFEGWLSHGEGGFMAFSDNWYWNYLNILAQKGGYIDISMEDDPLYFAMYTVNQVTDFFASDDVDGDNNLPQGSNSILDAMYAELEAQYPSDHPVRNAHEMTDTECAQIRDVVFPFIIRMTAGVLKLFAEENNLTQNALITSDTLNAYFYSYTNPVPDDETNKEISLYYITHNPFDPEVRVTIEKENSETIWDNVEVVLHSGVPREGYLPSWNFAKRLLLEGDYTGPITIQVSEDGVLTEETTVNYNPSNKPPLPILFHLERIKNRIVLIIVC